MYTKGYVAVVGKANVGKSSLVNAFVKQKIAIVSPKPQTTRNNIMGILTTEDSQFVFVDTPGMHSSKNNLDKFMSKNIRSAISDVDLILYVIDGSRPLEQDVISQINSLVKENKVILVISKIDIAKYEKVYPLISKLSSLGAIDIVPVSSLKEKNVTELLEVIKANLPKFSTKQFDFNEDEISDKSVSFLTQEIIREKTLMLLQDEIPHGIAINITKWDEDDLRAHIEADLICEKDSHKAIIIGNKGSTLSQIGTRAREDIEILLDKKVVLKLFVVVKKGWRDNTTYLGDFGYKDN